MIDSRTPSVVSTDAPDGLNSDAASIYQRRIADLQTALNIDQAIDRRFSTGRLVSFLVAAVLALLALVGEGVGYWIASGVSAFVFLAVVIANEPSRQRIETLRAAKRMLQRMQARVASDWKTLDRIGDPGDPRANLNSNATAVAGDLDLFGPVSLFRLVSLCGTAVGARTLGRWLTEPIDQSDANDRAILSTDMVADRDRRIDFYQTAETVGSSHGDPDTLVKWAESECWLSDRPLLIAWAKLSIAITFVALVLLVASLLLTLPDGAMQASVYAILLIPVINLCLSMTYLGPAHKAFAIALTNRRSVRDYQRLMTLGKALVDSSEQQNSLSDELLRRLNDPQTGGIAGFASLDRISVAGSLRTSAATFLIYLPLQLFGLYDVWILRRLERWQSTHRDHVARWFNAIGQIEAVASIAAVRDERPKWVTPQWIDPKACDICLRSEALGHPLLPTGQRVCNDVVIGPKGTLLLVTGSNMSGKSTMLRSVGLNVALAGAGGPVCATRLSLPPVEMATSIRVSDDLAQGVSFYMAELKRLKSVVDQAKSLSKNDDRVCLFLLDEILQGTNSRERQIAVARVLDQLVKFGAIGAITTHDLELADDPNLMSKSETVHFRETIRTDDNGNDEMTFDYRMQQGVCPTTNAIRLLEIVGL